MKKITILLAAALFMMALQTKGQNMALTTKQQALVAIAANEAKGDLEQLRASLNKGLDNGLTVSEAKEALRTSMPTQAFHARSTLSAYCSR